MPNEPYFGLGGPARHCWYQSGGGSLRGPRWVLPPAGILAEEQAGKTGRLGLGLVRRCRCKTDPLGQVGLSALGARGWALWALEQADALLVNLPVFCRGRVGPKTTHGTACRTCSSLHTWACRLQAVELSGLPNWLAQRHHTL